MVLGWTFTLGILMIMAVISSSLTASSWVVMNMVIQAFVMLADVPADGYSVELGQLESPTKRGQVSD